MKNNTKVRFTLKILINLAVIGGLVFFYIFGFNFLKNKSQFIADSRASISSQITKSQQSIDNKKQSDSVSRIGSDVDRHFLKSSDVPVFLNDIESIGLRTGAIISISSVDEFPGTEGGIVLNLSISASGSYQAVYRTLVELENLPYFSSLNSVAISIDQKPETSTDITKKIISKSMATLNTNLVIKSYSK